MSSLIDTHCHLYYEPYILDLNKTLIECEEKNVKFFITISVEYNTSKKNLEISRKYNQVYCTVGLHPNNVQSNKSDLENILSLVSTNKKIIGIGECGIDLFRSKDNLKDQITCFEKQIIKSLELNMPFVVHTRNADEYTYEVINKFRNKNLNFVIHCFSGSYQFAKKCIDLGGYISFGGSLTFKKNNILRDVCKKIPIDNIILETDSPYLAPDPHRGKINHPMYTELVAKKIADEKKISIEDVTAYTFHNFEKIFNIKLLK